MANIFVPSPPSQVEAQSIAGKVYPQQLPLTVGPTIARTSTSISGQVAITPPKQI